MRSTILISFIFLEDLVLLHYEFICGFDYLLSCLVVELFIGGFGDKVIC